VVFTAPAATGGVEPVLAGVGDGGAGRVLLPGQLGPFLQQHAGARLACHDAAALHHVLRRHLARLGDRAGERAWWALAREGRLYDVALLAELVQRAEDGARCPDRMVPLDQSVQRAEDGPRRPERLSLDQLALRHLRVCLPDDAALGAALSAVSPQAPAVTNQDLVQEVLRRAGAVFQLMQALAGRAAALAAGANPPRARGAFGPLALGLQVRGAVALADAPYAWLCLAPEAPHKIAAGLRHAQEANEALLTGDREARQCFKPGPDGRLRYRVDGSPKVRPGALNGWLRRRLRSVEGLHRTAVNGPRVWKGRVSDDPEDWGVLARCDPLLAAWADLVTAGEVCRACCRPGVTALRPRFEVLPHLHSRERDLEALRRFCGGNLFVPAPSHVFLVVGLRDLKLRALAAECQHRLGNSTLADIFAGAGDPCAHVAAALAGADPAAFAALEGTDPGRHGRWLQIARALLHAAPLGFREECVRAVARADFGLDDMGLTELRQLHERLLRQALPELSWFLRDDTLEALAGNLGTTTTDLEASLRASLGQPTDTLRLRQWLLGARPVDDPVRRQLGLVLRRCNARPPSDPPLETRPFGRELYLTLFGREVTTLAGRVLGRLLFAEARHLQYLGTADDAAKAALFALAEAGYRVVAFADNAIVTEVDGSADLAEKVREAEALARRGAEEVLSPIPAVCVGRVLASW
jgi:hypothetical protein